MSQLTIPVTFYSYFKDLAGAAGTSVQVDAGATLGDLMDRVFGQFPKLEPMRRSTLVAVGVDYQTSDYRLKSGDTVVMFPPVQGG